MLDFKFEGMIFADTAGQLLEQLEPVADDVVINWEGGLWAGVSKFAVREETFIDAFDRTVYQHDVYIPTDGDGEFCFGLYKKDDGQYVGYTSVSTAGELKQYLKDHVPPEFSAVSVDDNFELGGAITRKIKFLLIRRETLTLEFR